MKRLSMSVLLLVLVLAMAAPAFGQNVRGFIYLSASPSGYQCDAGSPPALSQVELYWTIQIDDLSVGEGVFGWEGSLVAPPTVITQAVQINPGLNFGQPPNSNFRVGTQVCVTAQPMSAAIITVLPLDDTLTNVAFTIGASNPSSPDSFGGPAWLTCDLVAPEIFIPEWGDDAQQIPAWQMGNVVLYWDGTTIGPGFCPPEYVKNDESSWGALKSQYDE